MTRDAAASEEPASGEDAPGRASDGRVDHRTAARFGRPRPNADGHRAAAGRERRLRPEERSRLAVLALPTSALALSITVVSTYLGTITRRYTHDAVVIGLIIGGEGVMALWVPLLAGASSDRVRTRLGGRLPFVLAGGIPAAAALMLIGFLGSLTAVAAAAGAFFGFYFVAYEPYRALYPDLFEGQSIAGRSQSAQAVARGLGTGLALLVGGLLLSVARPLPFVFCGFVLLISLGSFVWLLSRRGLPKQGHVEGSVLDEARRLWGLIAGHPALRAYLIANALWEMALAALKAFIVLYLTIGLRIPLATAALLIGGVALVILVGAAGAGKAGDRFGGLRVLNYALVAYGLGYLVPLLTSSRPLIAISVPFIAIGGGTVMTLAYAVLMPMMPADEHGAMTGFYSLSRGIGIVLGPLLAGIAIELSKHTLLHSTHGLRAMWLVCSAAIFLSIPFLRRLRGERGDREALERA
jgi:MFS family permease